MMNYYILFVKNNFTFLNRLPKNNVLEIEERIGSEIVS